MTKAPAKKPVARKPSAKAIADRLEAEARDYGEINPPNFNAGFSAGLRRAAEIVRGEK